MTYILLQWRDFTDVRKSVERKEYVIELRLPQPYRRVQIILRLYNSITHILTGFDLDCTCTAFDGKHVYASPRGLASLVTKTNIVDVTRRSPSYETRLWKYRGHFQVYFRGFDSHLVDKAKLKSTK